MVAGSSESVNEVVTEFTGKLFEALEGSVGSSRSKKKSHGFFAVDKTLKLMLLLLGYQLVGIDTRFDEPRL